MPIGIFDSGVGGLTVMKEVMRELPDEDIIYLGDTARVPYGVRSPETVTKYSLQNAQFLVSKGIKLLIVACNTSSAVSLDLLSERLPVPVIGVVNPGARAAASMPWPRPASRPSPVRPVDLTATRPGPRTRPA